jgi:hypothetical protein
MAYGDFVIAVGEEVGLVRFHRTGNVLFSKFGTVTKINGHGHIFVQAGDTEYRFTKSGDAYQDQWGPNLIHAAQLRAQLAAEERRKEQVRVAREMEQTLKDGYAYSGRFFVTQERVTALKNLLQKMEVLVDH